MHEVADGRARELLYTPDLFDFGQPGVADALPAALGFAGVRLRHPLNRPGVMDELAVFQGASYFRGLGRGQRYGLSARGLAIDTASERGEEFPAFRAWWLERPTPGADTVVMHALLDSPSCAGAYSFEIRPGEATTMQVSVMLYPRREVQTLGLAPLTSMFLFAANDRRGVDDFRPAVHDSDGLSMWNGNGEWLWRPLVNPTRLRVSSFVDRNPRGFGLMQRQRDFAAYQDLEARYELRPSAWVEPVGDWGPGSVRLVEIPSEAEIHDNIVAFWVPDQSATPGGGIQFVYRLHWCVHAPVHVPLAQVTATRVGAGGDSSAEADPGWRRFVLDFAGGRLATPALVAGVQPLVDANGGQLRNVVAHRNEVTGGWRASFELLPDGAQPVELRCVLRRDDQVLSETWLYQWTP